MDIIEIIILVAMAISGTVFGSFFTLAVHRIPRKEDITHERSYCPKCNHKLQFLDLIPVFSYIFLGGKCRYCKDKIRPRYLILEIFSGLVFLLIGLSYRISIETTMIEFASFALLILFLCSVFITAGIDKEKYIIPNGLMIYGLIIAILKVVLENGLTVLVTHFGLCPDEQENAVKTVLENIKDEKCILMGDFNVAPDNPLLKPIYERMKDTSVLFNEEKLSWPSDKPRMKIDYIFVSPDIEIVDADIPELVASDHRPHLAEIKY